MTDPAAPLDLLVLIVSGKDEPGAYDLGLTDSPEPGPPTDWLTIRRVSWPGRWPPRVGDVVTMVPAKITEVVAAPKRRASANKSVSGLAGSPD